MLIPYMELTLWEFFVVVLVVEIIRLSNFVLANGSAF